MKVYLIGAGPGDGSQLTGAAAEAIAASGLIVGAERLLEPFAALACEKRALVKATDIAQALRQTDATVASVLFSGDLGFYSGASLLRPLLRAMDDVEVVELPGISSLQYLCAKAGVAWQGFHLASAHGRDCNVAALVRQQGRVALLTGGSAKAHDVCAQLEDVGLGSVRVCAGERLSYPDERIVCGTAAEFAHQEFAALTALLICVDEPRRAPIDLARVLVAATGSGVGKTSFTCGLLRALQRRGLNPLACKCGPDYIDPLFHRSALGVASRNLDLFLMGEAAVRDELESAAGDFDLAVIEGAMGYYDGIATSDEASAWHLARVTDTPAILLVDARGKARSVAAEVLGFARMRSPHGIAGVVLNRVSPSYYPQLKALVEDETGIPVLGGIPVLEGVEFASRHLGLVPAGELADVQARLDGLADGIEQHVDLDALVALADRPAQAASESGDSSAALGGENRVAAAVPRVNPSGPAPRIAVARDEAFCFYYDSTLRLLEALGAELVEFSPLRDAALPEGTVGLYLGGGYPELHAAELAANEPLLAAVRQAVQAGLPTIAECGGFLYLHEQLQDDQGVDHQLAGIIPARAFKTGKLSRFGYVSLEAQRDSLLAAAGSTLRAHEFHYWDSTAPGDAFVARKPRSVRSWPCAYATPTLYAGFPHLCLAGAPEAAERFVAACRRYATGGEGELS